MRPEEPGGEIRKRAEDIARQQVESGDTPQEQLIYELKVHQIELEMQNAELQNSQQELQRSRRQYELLFDFAPVAYFAFNSEGGIVEANHAAATLLKTERKYLDRKPFVVFLSKEYHTAFFNHLRRVFELGHRQSVEIQINTRQGGQLWARLESRHQRGVKGEPQCFTAILDITDRKQIEDDLILAREDAVSANRAKSVFLANISHELRTPMSGILAMSELAQQQQTGPEVRRYLSTIHSAAKSLMTILDDVRDVTRIESDQLAIDKRPFRVGELVTTLQAMFQPNAAQKSLDLVVRVPDNATEVLVGDRNRIRQVLVNLLGNALTFTESGTVTLTIREEEVSDFLREITFEVADTGPGIEPAEQRRIFESFNRSLEDAEARYGGKGLGLAISRRLAKLMGGQLYFETDPGRGSRFFFSVPLELPGDEEDFDAAAVLPTTSGSGDAGRILVAEDNAINLLVIRTVLEKAGYAVVSVGNGRDAIARMEQERFDLVFMDISMPGMDGITATETIRARRDDPSIQADIPIVAISAHSMKGDRERFLEAGMNDYISKPFVRDTVLSVVRAHIGAGS